MCGTIAEVRENLQAVTLPLPSAILANLDSTNGGGILNISPVRWFRLGLASGTCCSLRRPGLES
jgi:hypothetical protein